jgi:hypothetical protein
MDGTRRRAASDRYLVQRQALLHRLLRPALDIEHGTPLDPVLSGRNLIDLVVEGVWCKLREETDSSEVNAQHRYLEGGRKSSDSNDGPISTQGDDQISVAADGGEKVFFPAVAQYSLDTPLLKLIVHPKGLFTRPGTARMVQDGDSS